MKKLLLSLIPLLMLSGCGNNTDTVNLDSPLVTVDGTVVGKYEDNDWWRAYSTPYHLVVDVDYIDEDCVYDLRVSTYVYNYYEIGDTIQFALKG